MNNAIQFVIDMYRASIGSHTIMLRIDTKYYSIKSFSSSTFSEWHFVVLYRLFV